jgi:hypothetical protein
MMMLGAFVGSNCVLAGIEAPMATITLNDRFPADRMLPTKPIDVARNGGYTRRWLERASAATRAVR